MTTTSTQTKKHNKLKPINPDTSCKFMILRNIAEQITRNEEYLTLTKRWINVYWEQSNRDAPTATQEDFNNLNYFKDIQRDTQKQLRNLRYIQKVVKLFPDGELTLSNAKDYSDNLKMWQSIAAESKPKKMDSRKTN